MESARNAGHADSIALIVRRIGMTKPPVQLVVGKKSYRKVKEEPPML